MLAGCAPQRTRTPAEPRPQDGWLERFGLDEGSLNRVTAALGASDGDFGEVYLQHRVSHLARLRDSGPEPIVSIQERGAALRLVRDGQVGFSASDDLGEASLLRAASRAATANPDAATPEARWRFTPPGSLYPAGEAFDAYSNGLRQTVVERVDALARADAEVTAVEVSLADADEWILIATLDGRLIADRRPMTRLSLQTSKSRGSVSHSGFASIAGRRELDWYTDERLLGLVNEALLRTDVLFDARRPTSGEIPVVLAAGSGGVLLHETVGHALEADFVQEGNSPYRDAIGTKIAGTAVSLTDDATIAGERGALNVDDEGEAGRRNVLIEGGVLKSLVHDRRSARRAGVAATGNGRRASWRHAPLPRQTCTVLENGAHEPGELLTSFDRGILAETFTGGVVDPGSGDFRFRVRHGWLIEGGRKRVPVRDFELIGNGPELLKRMTMVANDGRLDPSGWTSGKHGQSLPVSHGMPSALVSALGVEPLS